MPPQGSALVGSVLPSFTDFPVLPPSVFPPLFPPSHGLSYPHLILQGEPHQNQTLGRDPFPPGEGNGKGGSEAAQVMPSVLPPVSRGSLGLGLAPGMQAKCKQAGLLLLDGVTLLIDGGRELV